MLSLIIIFTVCLHVCLFVCLILFFNNCPGPSAEEIIVPICLAVGLMLLLLLPVAR